VTDLSFDLVCHLAGEQVLPNFIGIAQCSATHHVIIASQRTKFLHDRLATFDRLNSVCIDLCLVEPYNLSAIRSTLAAYLEPHKSKRIAFNLTGGTKPMFAAAYQLCHELKSTAFYVETTGRAVDILFPSCERIPLRPSFASVDDFVKLAGFSINDAGLWRCDPRRQQRALLTDACWRFREHLMSAKLQKLLQPWITENPFGEPFHITKGKIHAELDRHSRATVIFDQERFVMESFGDLAAYLAGKWFEEFCYLRLSELIAHGDIKDLRINFKPDWGNLPSRDGAQEFDLAFTDGFILNILECKAGFVKQVDFQKLENLAEQFGGTFGRGILLSCFPPSDSIRKRIQSSRSVAGIFGQPVNNITTLIKNIQPGTCLSKHP